MIYCCILIARVVVVGSLFLHRQRERERERERERSVSQLLSCASAELHSFRPNKPNLREYVCWAAQKIYIIVLYISQRRQVNNGMEGKNKGLLTL